MPLFFVCFNVTVHIIPLDLNKLYDITSSNTMLLDFLRNYFLSTTKNYMRTDTAAAAASPTTNFDIIAKITTFNDREVANSDLNFSMSEIDSDVDMYE